MNNDSEIVSFIFGMFFGVLILILALTFIPGSVTKQGKTVLEECEKSLPRDQYCTIIAIPEEINKENKK